MVDGSSEEVAAGGRTLVVGPLLSSPADAGVGGVRWNGCGGRTRNGRRVAAGAVVGNARRGRSRRRVGRATLSKADDLWTSNDKSIEFVSVNVGPDISVVHSGESGEIVGGWLVGASVLHVDLAVEEDS